MAAHHHLSRCLPSGEITSGTQIVNGARNLGEHRSRTVCTHEHRVADNYLVHRSRDSLSRRSHMEIVHKREVGQRSGIRPRPRHSLRSFTNI